jgi:ATP-dependent RNA helicase SrmB
VLAKRKEKKKEEQSKKKEKVRHRDKKNIGKRRTPAISSTTAPSATADSNKTK